MRPALVLFTALVIACGTSAPTAELPRPRVLDAAADSSDLAVGEEEVSMEIIELMCHPCASQIVSRSRLVPGVTHVSMVLASKTLIVRYDTSRTERERVISSVEQIVATIQ